ncbi:peptidase T [Acidipropionibacterium timonense]|uniref:peptidase T n=1 Tax=Acidipropionibacterium timonense TaxID=2161818 RepID=UPI001AEBE548|nr:peptidase T [Acidipropionibacterium timonense]
MRRGARRGNAARFPVELAWTIDSCEVGEIVAQTFNAASVSVLVEGVPAHPMSAKGVLVNPVLVAHDLIAEFDHTQTPECTDGTDGFIWVTDVVANESRARVDIVIRDHDLARFEERKETVRQAAQVARERHPRAKVEVTVEDVYGNIADAVTADNRAGVDLLFTAMDNLGITPRPTVMRGGTDGSWLSRQGILTPNFFTGGMNFHSSAEFLPLGSFQASHDMVLELVRLVALG